MDSPGHRDEQSGAIAEGRRIYLGNLLYATRPNEIEQALEDHGFGNYAQIHVSVDPVSGRNPGYCFVDFNDRETAESALNSLVATVRGRPLKVGPCQPKQQGQRRDARPADRWGSSREANTDSRTGDDRRWGDWKKGTDGRDNNNTPSGGKRLYIGNLGPMQDQEQNQQEIGDLLQGFAPTAIGKRLTARDRETNEPRPGQNYCFVDFATADEARQAMEALNGIPYGDEGNTLRVSIARGTPEGGRSRQEYQPRGGNGDRNGGDRDGNNGGGYRKRNTAEDGPPRALTANSWRRQD
ncbi:hypothetical protein Sste5346_004835 [Sporothrix stenoceras]|uniref:RRM domain-containing protein n=1 Tax=Sporothrix stenoceras TaxID=5173 RepID=A0ABR3Z651_9PEZI